METMRIEDVYGRNLEIAYDSICIDTYSNRTYTVQWNAEIVSGGTKTGLWTMFRAPGEILGIEARCSTWNNPARMVYAAVVDFNSKRNDPDNRLWNRMVQYVTDHKTDFFDDHGDWIETTKKARSALALFLKSPENGTTAC